MQCPEGDKEIIDDLTLFVSPCILSTSVKLMQECDNKVVQKSASFIKGCTPAGVHLVNGKRLPQEPLYA